jgi:hypothetical protein
MTNPKNQTEWQEAMDLAHLMTIVHSLWACGQVRTAPRVDMRRCEELLARARELGLMPAAAREVVERYFMEAYQ